MPISTFVSFLPYIPPLYWLSKAKILLQHNIYKPFMVNVNLKMYSFRNLYSCFYRYNKFDLQRYPDLFMKFVVVVSCFHHKYGAFKFVENIPHKYYFCKDSNYIIHAATIEKWLDQCGCLA